MSRLTRPARRLAIVITAIGLPLAGLVGLPAASGAQPGPARAASVATAANTFQIQAGSGKCLSPAFGELKDGLPVVQRPCDGSTAQRWYLTTEVGSGTPGQLLNAATNRCVDLTGWAHGSVAVIWPCYDGNPHWLITTRSGHSRIQFTGITDSCLDLASSSVQDGAPAWSWSCNDTSAQQWHLI
jgi:hypothetical protein